LAQRSRKRGRRGRRGAPPPRTPAARPARPPQQVPPAHLPQPSRSERKNAEVRAALRPLTPGERPWIIVVSSLVAAALALANLIAWVAGDKINGKHPAASGILIFTAVLLVCAVGLWRLWYGAVLGFMALMAIIAVLFTLYLIEASNILGAVVAVLVVGVCGFLFFKLVRVLSRIQMPNRPTRPSR
jgi:hypothetical protein